MYVTRNEGQEVPQRISWIRKLGRKTFQVALDVQEVTDEQSEMVRYSWKEVQFDPGIPTVADLISAIIRCRYSADDIEGINNNYMLNDGNEEHIKEWSDMQDWRKYAKTTAKEILKEIEEIAE